MTSTPAAITAASATSVDLRHSAFWWGTDSATASSSHCCWSGEGASPEMRADEQHVGDCGMLVEGVVAADFVVMRQEKRRRIVSAASHHALLERRVEFSPREIGVADPPIVFIICTWVADSSVRTLALEILRRADRSVLRIETATAAVVVGESAQPVLARPRAGSPSDLSSSTRNRSGVIPERYGMETAPCTTGRDPPTAADTFVMPMLPPVAATRAVPAPSPAAGSDRCRFASCRLTSRRAVPP